MSYNLLNLPQTVNQAGMQMANYYNTTDHLASIRVITDQAGTVAEQNDYYPFGKRTNTGEQYLLMPANRYKFNGKELQTIANMEYLDYGARLYDPTIARWLSVDPLAEKYTSVSPYAYCYNNPIRFIDPDGMQVDDYFNKKGEFLGSDEAKTDNVKIIDQKDWDANKALNPDGSESITHATGSTISTDHSKSNLTEEATLNVYNHYNPTGLELKAKQNETGAGGLTFHAERKNGKTSEWIDVKIDGNKRTKVADHANEITNSFIHEGKHYSDYKTLGFDGYVSVPENRREQREISTQMKHESFKGTRSGFQRAVKRYGQKHGMIFLIKPKPAILIPN